MESSRSANVSLEAGVKTGDHQRGSTGKIRSLIVLPARLDKGTISKRLPLGLGARGH